MTFRFFLLDDGAPGAWAPFSLTRPVGEMLFGAETLRARCERVAGVRCDGWIGSLAGGDDGRLSGFEEPGTPPWRTEEDLESAKRESGILVLSGRFVPGEDFLASLRAGGALRSGGATLLANRGTHPACGAGSRFDAEPPGEESQFAGFWLPRDEPWPADWRSEETRDAPRDPERAPPAPPPHWTTTAVEGAVLGSVWELMNSNGAQIAADARRFRDGDLPPGVHRVGDGMVGMAGGVRIEPGVVFDVSKGPVLLDEDVRVRAFCRIAGPTYVGPGSVVLGGSIAATSIGAACRVHGEVSASVLLGFANKAHEGFLGHSVVGRWVNLGAGTTNSNLKNTYGTVRWDAGDGPRTTGLVKAGCLLGDHVRTGIGTLLDTGSAIGAGSVLFGGAMPPKHVPPFSWAGPAANDLDECDVDRFLVTAGRVMARRGQSLSEGMRRLYRRAFSESRPLRAPGR